MKCANCESECPPALVVRSSGDDPVTLGHLCSACVDGVLTLKIVLKRTNTSSPFTFDGYLPVESEK